MAGGNVHKRRKGSSAPKRVDVDSEHHSVRDFRPQTPLHLQSDAPAPAPKRTPSPWSTESKGLWNDLKSLRWVVVPSSSLKMLLLLVLLWAAWEALGPSLFPNTPNPFTSLLFITHRVPGSPPADPRYQKGPNDLLFVAYHIVFWSFVRQSFTIYVCRPVARRCGLRRQAKLDRFGEQAYAILYWGLAGAWGLRIMGQLPTWWYRTEYFWIDYPHWDMKPELKRYYLMQAAYWCQQFLILVLKLEKPRKDYAELIAHHIVTLWLVGWSYLVNLTFIGNAVFVSMDIPDAFLGLSKLLNYLQWNRAKIGAFVVFITIWTYFRHYLNIIMLWSVWTQFDLMPETSKRWSIQDGVWMVWWMKYQIFVPLLLLQFLNIFWYYYFIIRIAVRAIHDLNSATDDRSDDEDEEEPEEPEKDD